MKKTNKKSPHQKHVFPQKAHAEVRSIDNKWVAIMQGPGSYNIMSKNFDTEDDAIKCATEFLVGYRQ